MKKQSKPTFTISVNHTPISFPENWDITKNDIEKIFIIHEKEKKCETIQISHDFTCDRSVSYSHPISDVDPFLTLLKDSCLYVEVVKGDSSTPYSTYELSVKVINNKKRFVLQIIVNNPIWTNVVKHLETITCPIIVIECVNDTYISTQQSIYSTILQILYDFKDVQIDRTIKMKRF